MSEKPDEGTVIVNGNSDASYISFDDNLVDYVATSDGLTPMGDALDRSPLTADLKIMSSAPLMLATLSDHPGAGATLNMDGQRIYANASQVIDTLDEMHCTPAGWGTRSKLPAYAQHEINGKSRIYIDLSNSW
jgi:hypothetical protein